MSGIILFDGVCNLCNQAVDFVIKHDKKKAITSSLLYNQRVVNA